MPNETYLIEDAKLMFRNLSGRKTDFNDEGRRNFCVEIHPSEVEKLRADGWNIKEGKVLDEDGIPTYYVAVNVNFDGGRPPLIVLDSNGVRTQLGADEVGLVDAADIAYCDVNLNLWHHKMNGGGIKPYLKSMFVKLNVDELEKKYGLTFNLGEPIEVEASSETDAVDENMAWAS